MRYVLGSRASIGGVLGSGRGGAAAAAWYLAGGVSAANCVAAYQPKGAASLAASYTNLANPGTYDCTTTSAPTFSAATGWTFDGLTQYLTTNYTPPGGGTKTLIVRCDAVPANPGFQYIAGTLTGGNIFGLRYQATSSTQMLFLNGSNAVGTCSSDPRNDGVAAVAGSAGYWNGTDVGISLTAGATLSYPLFIGGLNSSGTLGNPANTIIKALAIYSTTLTAPQVAAISAAMAAL